MSNVERQIDEEKETLEKIEQNDEEEEVPYGLTESYLAWHKHVRDLYQTHVFIDTTWTTRSCQFMPYVTVTQQHEVVNQTILTGTDRGHEQNYIQLIDTTMPSSMESVVGSGLNLDSYEVGGYGSGCVSKCGVKVSRRLYHDGAVLACRYMPANPLLIASSSSDGNCYIFDISRCSLSSPPNDVERPTCRYALRPLPEGASLEEKKRYFEKKHTKDLAEASMRRWDSKKGAGQHQLILKGNKGEGVPLDWNTTNEGVLSCGSDDRVAYWRVSDLSKNDPKTVEPFRVSHIDSLINDVKFSWFDPNRSYITAENTTLTQCDLRKKGDTIVVRGNNFIPTTLALSPLNDVALALGGSDGVVRVFDQRNFIEPVLSIDAHATEVGPMSWSPFVEGHLATGGQDASCAVLDLKSSQLLFRHAAHQETILDIDWCWQEQSQGQLISCDQNAVTVWKPRNIYWSP